MRILVVEDDPVLGPLTCDLLESKGHKAILAEDAKRGLAELAAAEKCHVVLLDLQVGDVRGEELIHRARHERLPVPPVIIVSAQPIEQLRKAADEIGASAIVQK